MSSYLSSAKREFHYYKELAEKAILELSEEQIFFNISENSNNIGVLIKHISGNMLSRWTDFKTTDGEKTWRNRDKEFELIDESKADLLSRWAEAWQVLFDALESVETSELEHIVYIRNEGHTIIEAINRQIAHIAMHVGQIVFVAKALLQENWKVLSIPKNGSEEFNRKKFGKPKTIGHFLETKRK